MAHYQVGRVGIVPRGAYSATTIYEPLDLITKDGGSYVNKLGCTGIEPTNTTHWQVSAQKGATGAQGVKGDVGATGPQGPKGDAGTVPLPLAMSQVTGLTDGMANKVSKSGDTVTGQISITNTTTSTSQTTGALVVAGGIGLSGDIRANRVYGAVWNDYAERRMIREEDAGYGQVVCEMGDDTLAISTMRLQPAPYVISDTFGFEIGMREEKTLPVAVAGRVLVHVEGNRHDYYVGDIVCAGTEGNATKMTREEVAQYPDRILGLVCAVPEYDRWADAVEVNNRVWIRV